MYKFITIVLSYIFHIKYIKFVFPYISYGKQ